MEKFKHLKFLVGGSDPVNLTSNLTHGLSCKGRARGRSSLFALGRHKGIHSERIYPALRLKVYVLSSLVRLLSNLLIQIRCFDYRNNPVRVQS